MSANVEDAVKAYLAIRRDLEAKSAAFRAEKNAHEEQMEKLATFVEAEMLKTNQQRAGFVTGSVSFRTKDFVNTQDWHEFLKFLATEIVTALNVTGCLTDQIRIEDIIYAVSEISALSFLTKKVSKTVVKEWMKERGGMPPPGISYEKVREISITAPKAGGAQ